MEIFIGTSGWSYNWNEGKSLSWYIHNSNLNAIELNMSFYRFPYPNMVKSWVNKGKQLAWVIKVHRSITHYKKLNKESYDIFEKFQKLFKPLENCIHYYLIQLPPRFTDIDVLDRFIDECNCDKICVEFRHHSLFTDKIILWGKKKGVLIVSVDAPDMPRKIMSEKIIYERIHGRSEWYAHNYTREELIDIKNNIISNHPEQLYIFFNNHLMFDNAKAMSLLLL